MIDVPERLAGQLARGIGRDGREDGVAFREWDARVDPIDRGRRGDGNLFDAIAPGGLEEVDGAFDVDPLIEGRFFQAWPHAGSGGKVNDLVEFDAAEQLVQHSAVGEVAVHELEGLGEGLNVPEIALLKLGVVEGVQVIQGPEGVA